MSEQEAGLSWNIHSVRTGPRGAAPVVLVHPLGLDLTYWDHQIEALRDDFDVIALDLPGHGMSTGRPADWTMNKAVSMLEQVIRSAGVSSAHIVGLSVGSMMAQAFALAKPRMVSSLTLIGSATTFSQDVRDYLRGLAKLTREGGMHAIVESSMPHWFASRTREYRPDILDRAAKTLRGIDPTIHAAMWEMIANFDRESEVHRITCPTLILVGDQDVSTPPAASVLLAKLIPASEMHLISGGGHMLPFEAPQAVNNHLLHFLRTATETTS
jgi:3-oxoadipate enol-lactonase